MQIDAQNRRVSLSVGEFAAFRPYAAPGFGGVSAVWRAQVGTQWHQQIQSDSEANNDGMQNEVSIAGELSWRGWTLTLSGRIDQLKQNKQETHLREIKTVSQPLPLTREFLLERYQSYPIQLLTYRELLRRNLELGITNEELGDCPDSSFVIPNSRFQLELFFVEISSGLTQSLPLDSSYNTLLVDQLDTFVDSLEAQQERLQRLRSLSIRSAYETPRPGQENIQQELDEAFSNAPFTLLEAPTGYGKTGVAWEYAARRLAAGQEDRILYLTSKSTGQIEALERLRSLLAPKPNTQHPAPSASFWHIRNKQEHCIHSEFRCSSKTCPYLSNLDEKWKRAGLQRLYLLSQDEHSLEILHAEGKATGICPYEIMRAGLGHRDIWIGDYNYLFSPNSTRLLEEQSDFNPARTFLILDEAHNLPSRVASSYTFDLDSLSLFAAADDLHEAKAPRKLQFLLKSLAGLISSKDLEPKAQVPNHIEDDFNDHLIQLAEILVSEPLPYDELQAETSDLLFLLNSINSAQKRGKLKHLLWSPSAGNIRLECIDASKLIHDQLKKYSGVLALSATLSPIDSFLEEIGCADLQIRNEKSESFQIPNSEFLFSHLTPQAPWRTNAYDVAIDLRVNTRYKTRDSHLATTADTIAVAVENLAPVVVFFPSYAYSQKIYDALYQKHPFIRVAQQPRRGGTLAERTAYLEEALAFNDVIFLILGSSYAEGVDTLGGKAGLAIVVSPALPEMNFIQEAKREQHDKLNRNGFERAYLQPGIQKVNQALGRLIRAPGHFVKILLHCERFADKKTKRFLDPLYQSKAYIHSNDDLSAWLNDSTKKRRELTE